MHVLGNLDIDMPTMQRGVIDPPTPWHLPHFAAVTCGPCVM